MPQDQDQEPIKEYNLEKAPLGQRLRVRLETGISRPAYIDLLQVDDGRFVVVGHPDSKLGVVCDITPILRVGGSMSLRWTLMGKRDQSTVMAGNISSLEVVHPGDTSNVVLVNAALMAPKAKWYAVTG